MPTMLPFLFRAENRKSAGQSVDTEALAGFEKARQGFSVNWVLHGNETRPIEVETSALDDLDKLVEICRGRFDEKTRMHPDAPPDGFLVCDNAGNEVRRWFKSVRPKNDCLKT